MIEPSPDGGAENQNEASTNQEVVTTEVNTKPHEAVPDSKKDADKISIYKALAIKLKKELVKCREELQKLRDINQEETTRLSQEICTLKDSLDSERLANITTSASLEATVKSLRHQLETSENDLHKLQDEFENYRLKASQIMHQTNPTQSSMANIFIEDRYKQMKALNDDQVKQIADLEAKIISLTAKNENLTKEAGLMQKQLDIVTEKLKAIEHTEKKCDSLMRENENLKSLLKQFCVKPSDSDPSQEVSQNKPKSPPNGVDGDRYVSQNDKRLVENICDVCTTEATEEHCDNPSSKGDSPQTTTTNSSVDGSTSGYVHIKPATFEIISRSSVLEDAQNQIDHLTKAYLESESTNLLLNEQVRALKEEIRRIQRVNERMQLADNLEYLKNIVFKFLSLEAGQAEQKQRLIPVLSTVLKLSPDETTKLMQIASTDKTSVTSSFFKF